MKVVRRGRESNPLSLNLASLCPAVCTAMTIFQVRTDYVGTRVRVDLPMKTRVRLNENNWE